MRHDYDHPPDWDAMSKEDKSKWMTQERCRKQAMNQDTPSSEDIKSQQERRVRRVSARPGTISLSDYR